MTRARVRPFYGWLMVGGLGLTELVSWGVLVYAFSVLVVPMRNELNWSTAELNAADVRRMRRDDHRHGGHRRHACVVVESRPEVSQAGR